VGNIGHWVSEDDLLFWFYKFGTVANAKVRGAAAQQRAVAAAGLQTQPVSRLGCAGACWLASVPRPVLLPHQPSPLALGWATAHPPGPAHGLRRPPFCLQVMYNARKMHKPRDKWRSREYAFVDYTTQVRLGRLGRVHAAGGAGAAAHLCTAGLEGACKLAESRCCAWHPGSQATSRPLQGPAALRPL
jgi:hypothetical protein